MFLVGLAGAFRRSELVGIDVEHLRFENDSVIVRIPRSKTDQAGEGAEVALPRTRGEDTCPIAALEAWLRRARIRRGPVFRRITAAGTIEGRPDWGRGLQDPPCAGRRGETHRLGDRAAVAARPARGDDHRGTLNGALDEQIMRSCRTRGTKDAGSMRRYRRRARIVVDNLARLLDL